MDTGKGVYRRGGAALTAMRDSRDTCGTAWVLFYGDVDFVQAGGGIVEQGEVYEQHIYKEIHV